MFLKWSQSIFPLRGWIFFPTSSKRMHTPRREKIGYSWNESEKKIAVASCEAAELLPKAMNNKILKSTDKNINMKFLYVCWQMFLLLSLSLFSCSCACVLKEEFMEQFYCSKRIKHFYQNHVETSLFPLDGDRLVHIKYDLLSNGQFVKSCWKWLEIHWKWKTRNENWTLSDWTKIAWLRMSSSCC